MKYAAHTRVSEEKSRGQIELAVRNYAGRGSEFTYGLSGGRAAVQFVAHGRRVRLDLPLATEDEAMAKAGRRGSRRPATPAQVKDWLAQEDRRRWRCLLLIVKAKFAAVEVRVEMAESEDARERAFEQEFLAYFALDGGKTIYDLFAETEVDVRRLLRPAGSSP